MRKKRMGKSDKRNFKEKKEKKTCITWEDNGMYSSSNSENEIINLDLMVKDYERGEELTY